MEKLISRIATLTTAMLMEMAQRLFVDDREESDIVFREVLNALEARMPEAAFVTFCEAL